MEWKQLENTVQTKQVAGMADPVLRLRYQIPEVEVSVNAVSPVDVWHANVKLPVLYEIVNVSPLQPHPGELSYAWRLADLVVSFPSGDIMNTEELPDTTEIQALTNKTQLRL